MFHAYLPLFQYLGGSLGVEGLKPSQIIFMTADSSKTYNLRTLLCLKWGSKVALKSGHPQLQSSIVQFQYHWIETDEYPPGN